MACENIVITIEETNEVIEIIVNDFSVSNILSNDAGNNASLGTDGGIYVPTPTPGITNHSQLILDDGTNPHNTTKNDVGLGNADNTSDANKPISNATQTALDLKEDLSNKKTTITGNETSNVFYASVKAIVDWVTLLFVPKTRTITVNGDTQDLSGNVSFTVGSSSNDEFIYAPIKWKTCRFNTINTWRTPTPFPDFYDTETFASHGTGTAPVDGGAGLYASWNQIPAGFLIDSFELNVNLKLVNSGSTSSNLQVYIERAEVSTDSVSVSSSNVVVLVNQVVSIGAGSDRMKFMKTLTVASHSAPTLAKSFYRIWARETTTTDVYYSLAFNPIFKKI